MNALIAAVADLVGLAQDSLQIGFLVFLRVGAMMALLTVTVAVAVVNVMRLICLTYHVLQLSST